MSEPSGQKVKEYYKRVRLYRHLFLIFAFITQIIGFFCWKKLMPYIHPHISFQFTYIILTILGETILYRILKLKESHHIHESLIQAEFNLTAEELDTYILKLVDIRVVATGIALWSYVISMFLELEFLTVVAVFGSYFLTTIACMAYLRITKAIKVPKNFFLLKPEDRRPYYRIDEVGRPIMSDSASSMAYGMTSSSMSLSGCDFKPIEMASSFNDSFQNSSHSFHNNSSFHDSFQSSSFSSPIQPANYGTPGYDSGGIYTGSSTAMGGISN